MPASTMTDQRDLNFKPVDNPSPRTLTAEQIEQYNTDGHVFPFDVYSDLEAARNRAYFDWILAEMRLFNDGRDAYAINCYQARCRGIYDIATDPRILDLVEDIVGPNIVCWASHFFCKEPHNPKAVPWHQDASYWPLTPARTVTVWLAIDDVDTENAPMQVIPGTHNRGHIEWKKTDKDAVLDQEIVGVETMGEPVPIVLRAGQISLHADMIVHGSEPNASDRRRCGLTLRYCPPEVRCVNPDWKAEAIIARGEDPAGHWTHHPRPAGEDLSRKDKPRSVGGN